MVWAGSYPQAAASDLAPVLCRVVLRCRHRLDGLAHCPRAYRLDLRGLPVLYQPDHCPGQCQGMLQRLVEGAI